MKIAFTSDDAKNITAHFGHCRSFLVLTVEDNRIKARETRPLSGATNAPAQGHGSAGCFCHNSGGGGYEALSDCDAVVTLGMGPRAAAALKASGIQPVVLQAPLSPEDAALAYAAGKIPAYSPAGDNCCHDSQ